MAPPEKRSRSLNWTPVMKELLVEATKPFSQIIDSKLNDGKTIKSKFDAWESISASFKASGYDLTAKQVRERWSRYKTKARTNISVFNRSQKETGGGTPPKEPSEIDYEIADIAQMDFLEDTAEFDCDAIYSNEKENVTPQSKPKTPPPIEKTPPPNEKTPPPKQKTFTRTTQIKRKSRRLPTVITSEELIKERIIQIEMETKKKEHLFLKRRSAIEKIRSARKKTGSN